MVHRGSRSGHKSSCQKEEEVDPVCNKYAHNGKAQLHVVATDTHAAKQSYTGTASAQTTVTKHLIVGGHTVKVSSSGKLHVKGKSSKSRAPASPSKSSSAKSKTSSKK